MTDFFDDLDRLKMPAQAIQWRSETTKKGLPNSPKPRKIKGEFLKGPIPLDWLSIASRLPGKASLTVALAIWFEAGRKRSKQIVLTTAILDRFGVNRKAKYRALESLEKAGLIAVGRAARRNPSVTIMDVQNKFVDDKSRQDGTDPAHDAEK